MLSLPQYAIWFASPNLGLLEAINHYGIRQVLIDLEHGVFTLPEVNQFIFLAKSMGMTVHAKVMSADMSPIQQMLDLGADSVIIPHIEGITHAEATCAYAKFAPIGTRSCAGGRTLNFGPADADYFYRQNTQTACYPMIETAASFEDITAILALNTVDGVFIGPTDLSLSQGRGPYEFDEIDKSMISKIAKAAHAANKPWIMPAWRPEERSLAYKLGADCVVFTHEQIIIDAGVKYFIDSLSTASK